MRLINADKFKEYMEEKSSIAEFLAKKKIIHEDSAKMLQIFKDEFKDDIDKQPTVSAVMISGKTETGVRKITIFQPHVQIEIFVNEKMLEDWKRCREYLDNESEPPDGICYSCELFRDIYPGSRDDLCDIPEIREKLKEWTGYGI